MHFPRELGRLEHRGLIFDSSATVHNSVAYRALGVEFELWSYAPLGVTSLYLEHFQYLLIDSKHRRFNLLRTFQKSSMIRKLLYALRSGLFDPAVVPVVVGRSSITGVPTTVLIIRHPQILS